MTGCTARRCGPSTQRPPRPYPGTANGDGHLDAANLVALMMEIDNGDGVDVSAVGSGYFAGSAALDVKGDGKVVYQDVQVLVRQIFQVP